MCCVLQGGGCKGSDLLLRVEKHLSTEQTCGMILSAAVDFFNCLEF